MELVENGARRSLISMPELEHGQKLHIEVDQAQFDPSGRKWVLYVVQFDPDRPKEPLTEGTLFFARELKGGKAQVNVSVMAPAVSIFLAPLEDGDVGRIVSKGGGTLKQFANLQGLRHVLEALGTVVEKLQGAEPIDFKSKLGEVFLKELGIEPGDDLTELLPKLKKIGEEVRESGFSSFAQGAVSKIVFGFGAGAIGPGPLSVARPLLEVFDLLETLQHKHDFRLYELQAQAPDSPDGPTILSILDEDVDRIRLDENQEGAGQKDLRHILAWHYRPLMEEARKIGLVHVQGVRFMAYLQAKNDALVPTPSPTIEVKGDEYEFEPSATLAVTNLQGWTLDPADTRHRLVKVTLEQGGVLRLSGLDAVRAAGTSEYNTRLEVPYGFETLKSGFFTLKLR